MRIVLGLVTACFLALVIYVAATARITHGACLCRGPGHVHRLVIGKK